jgi:hypothetical protein
MSTNLRIVILGMMGRSPFGGQTWLYLNWLRAFQRLGHEVWYIEDDSVWPYDPLQNTVTDDCSYAVRHISACTDRIGLSHQWAFRLAGQEGKCFGISPAEIDELYRSCDVLLNIVGATDLREEHLQAKLRVYVETDPVSAELQYANGDEHTRREFAKYHRIFTYGENYGAPDCGVPLNGKTYSKTRQPVDLDLWPMAYDPEARFFTTIGNYRQSGNDLRYKNEVYHWSKHHEWEKFLDLPKRSSQAFELALMHCNSADQYTLRMYGWNVVSTIPMSLDIFGAYRDYFRQSRGEFSVAKDQNVRLRSGWFSERDATYLATGKPVVAQDTGFSNIFPCDEGLFAICNVEQAAAAIQLINADYRKHCEAARRIAEDYFSAPRIATKLLQDLGL